MSGGFGITGISGIDPYMSMMGTYGLGTGGAFGSYDAYMNPMMGAYGGAMGYGGLGSMGMMGMYNPAFMAQMNQVQQEIEKSQLKHQSAMHSLILDNKLEAHRAEDDTAFKKSMEDKGLTKLVESLAIKIRESDSDGACEEFDKLKNALYKKHNAYIKENQDRLDPREYVVGIIEDMYATLISAKTGEQVSLRNDLIKYGETAFSHGFNQTFMGKKDYHGKYTEETMNYLYGTRIDNKGGKDRMEKIGGYAGHIAEGATAGAVGTGIGLGITGVTALVKPSWYKVANEEGKKVFQMAKLGKTGKWMALIGGAALTAGDIFWQMSR